MLRIIESNFLFSGQTHARTYSGATVTEIYSVKQPPTPPQKEVMEVEEEAERRYVLWLQPLDEIEGSLWPTKHVNVMNIIDMDLPHTHTHTKRGRHFVRPRHFREGEPQLTGATSELQYNHNNNSNTEM